MTAATGIRPPAVAGSFYPGDPDALIQAVDTAVARAAPWEQSAPKALVAPHAGYVYSGPTAGHAYRTLAGARHTVRRVVLVGPAHYAAVDGVAVSSADAFATPLGSVPVDAELRAAVLTVPGVVVDDDTHALEHSLEVHLPFLQRTIDDFSLLPLLVGRVAPDTVARVLDQVWGGSETLVVVSTDLSHSLDYGTAAARDRLTAAAIVAGEGDAIEPHHACGATPVRGLLVAACGHGLRAQLLDLRSSGDTAGSRDRVVGYAAIAFSPTPRSEPA